ncbi:MAG: two pore domain potassium channel family protein [Tabrizicola sp.]|nr:two pore domain potassium channel family protein [Tabrizicola sp.]
MLVEIALGSGLLVINIVLMAIAAFALESLFQRAHSWLIAPPQRPKLLLLLVGVGLWVLAVITAGVWIWAFALHALGAFPVLEDAVYFALVAFTTLGLGDLVPPPEWRILAVMASVNGFLSFGLLTALLVETLRQIRLAQIAKRRGDS